MYKHLPLGSIKPFINRDSTAYTAEGSWYDIDKVRFVSNYPQSLGGWQKQIQTQFVGICRFMDTWKTLLNQNLTALGTHNHLYIEYGGVFNDITPVDSSTSTANILNTQAGSTNITVSVAGHTRQINDTFVVINQATTVGGNILLEGEYVISDVPSVDSFVITTNTTAAATSAGAGGAINYVLPLSVGNQSNISFEGYSRGVYSEGGYSYPLSSSSLYRDIRIWSGGTWGEDYLFNPANRGLYLWDATNGVSNRATIVSTAPSSIFLTKVHSASRQVVAYGVTDAVTSTFNPMLVRWSSQEDYTDWVTSAGNTAGDYVLPIGSRIVATFGTRAETLIYTDSAIYTQKYVGSPSIFTFDLLGKGCAPIGPLAIQEANGVVYWMGEGGFWKYDGGFSLLPCSFIRDIYNQDGQFPLDRNQKEKTYCGINSRFNEIIWLYQSTYSTTEDIDRYIIYNYKLDTMYYGSFDRTCWVDSGIAPNPRATDTNGFLYEHELGFDEDVEPFNSYIQTGDFDLSEGEEFMFVDRIIPDCVLTGNLWVRTTFKKYPNDTLPITKTFKLTNSDNLRIDFRGRGRLVNIKFSSSVAASTWKLGNFQMRVQPNGRS